MIGQNPFTPKYRPIGRTFKSPIIKTLDVLSDSGISNIEIPFKQTQGASVFNTAVAADVKPKPGVDTSPILYDRRYHKKVRKNESTNFPRFPGCLCTDHSKGCVKLIAAKRKKDEMRKSMDLASMVSLKTSVGANAKLRSRMHFS